MVWKKGLSHLLWERANTRNVSFTNSLRRLIYLYQLRVVSNSCLFHDCKRNFIVFCRFSNSECLVRTFSIHGRKVSCVWETRVTRRSQWQLRFCLLSQSATATKSFMALRARIFPRFSLITCSSNLVSFHVFLFVVQRGSTEVLVKWSMLPSLCSVK